MSEAPFAAPGSRGSGGGERGADAAFSRAIREFVDATPSEFIPPVVGSFDFVAEPSPIIGGTVTWPVEEAARLIRPVPKGYEGFIADNGRFSPVDYGYNGHSGAVGTHPGAFFRATPSDDDRNSYFPRALPNPVRDIGGARRVDEGSNLRRGWLDRLKRSRLSRLTWHKCAQLGLFRRDK